MIRFGLLTVLFCQGARIALAQESLAAVPAYRHRILGVFDVATGEPIEDAEVTDVKSGTKAMTTLAGRASTIQVTTNMNTAAMAMATANEPNAARR